MARISLLPTAVTQKQQYTGQTLLTDCITLQNALRQCTSTCSAPGAPTQRSDIPIVNPSRKPWSQGSFLLNFSLFQMLLAPLLGQKALNCAATIFSNSAKLLRDPWGHNQALKCLNLKLSGPKETREQNQLIK